MFLHGFSLLINGVWFLYPEAHFLASVIRVCCCLFIVTKLATA
ncbi:hypothetical protein P20480_2085 [Pseudoalteromonas sp. BSi20480]|nr:hypothetical protein P20480_2085 [Pseudoalteromonas sp. BSi20480]